MADDDSDDDNDDDDDEVGFNTGRKIGRFLIVVGGGLIAFFVLTDLAQQVNFTVLLIGAVALAFGIFLTVSNPNPEPRQAPRFRTLNKIMKKDAQEDKKLHKEK